MTMYTWRELWKAAIHYNPPVDYFSPVTAAVIYYAIIIGFTYVLHTITHGILPRIAKEYATDFFKTLMFCAFPLGHFILREYYGGIGYFIASVIVVMLALRIIKGGSGSPLEAFERFITGKIKLWKFALKVFIQMLAGLAAYNSGMLVFMLDLHPFHRKVYEQEQCMTDLHVPFWVGFIIETTATLYLTWLEFQSISRYSLLDDFIKIGNCSFLVVFGIQFTGMYLHPAMASAYSFGCSGTPNPEHLVVYWLGPFLGTYLGYCFYSKFTPWKKQTSKAAVTNGSLPLKKSKSTNNNNNNNNNNNKRNNNNNNNNKKNKHYFPKQKKKRE